MTDTGGDRDGRTLALWRLALWTALVTGLLEASIVSSYSLHRLSEHVVWMAPVADVAVFGAVALLLRAIGHVWRPAAMPENAALVFAALATTSLALMTSGRLHILAILLLAAGVGWQTRRLVLARRARVATVLRVTFWWVPALVLVLTVVTLAEPGLRERRALAEVGEAREGAPNILLLILDTVRAKSMGLYGYERPTTPALERWAARGVVFDRAIATAPWTLTSHVGIFTGRYPHETTADWERPMDGTHPTIAEVLAAHGYATAGFVANLLYCNEAYGLARGFQHYEDYPVSLGQLVVSSALGRAVVGSRTLQRLVGWRETLNHKNAARLTDDFLAWERTRDPDRPFFAFLNYFDAHEPLLPPEEIRQAFGPARSPDAPWEYVASIEQGNRAERDRKWEMLPEEVAAERAAYDGAIAFLDQELGRLFEELERRGLAGNTVVIVTSDHGEQFGEHGLFGHLNSLYLPLLHVPLVVVAPGRVPEGTRVGTFATLAELPATLAAFAGVEEHPFPGTSLARFWDVEAPPAADVGATEMPILAEISRGLVRHASYPTAKGSGVSLIREGLHFVRYGRPDLDPTMQLFDLRVDFEEEENLAGERLERVEAMAVVVDSVRGR